MIQTMLWCCAECMASAPASDSCMSTCASSEKSCRYSCMPTSLRAFVRAHSKGLHAMFSPHHSKSPAGMLLQSDNNVISNCDNNIESSVTLNTNVNCCGDVNKNYIKILTLDTIKEPIPHHTSGIACITQPSNNSVHQVLTSCRQNLMLPVT